MKYFQPCLGRMIILGGGALLFLSACTRDGVLDGDKSPPSHFADRLASIEYEAETFVYTDFLNPDEVSDLDNASHTPTLSRNRVYLEVQPSGGYFMEVTYLEPTQNLKPVSLSPQPTEPQISRVTYEDKEMVSYDATGREIRRTPFTGLDFSGLVEVLLDDSGKPTNVLSLFEDNSDLIDRALKNLGQLRNRTEDLAFVELPATEVDATWPSGSKMIVALNPATELIYSCALFDASDKRIMDTHYTWAEPGAPSEMLVLKQIENNVLEETPSGLEVNVRTITTFENFTIQTN